MRLKEFYDNSLLIKIFFWVIVVFAILFLIIFLFFLLWPPFGGSITKKDKDDYAKRFPNYHGKFTYNGESSFSDSSSSKNEFLSDKKTKPIDKIPIEKVSPLENPSIEDLTISWLGHSSLWIQMSGMNIFIDPVFSKVTSPVSFIGPKRFSEVPVEIDNLPTIDIVIITHDHYDHLDYDTIKKIDSKVKQYIVPLGVEKHLERWKIDSQKIKNMSWWEEIQIQDLTIGCVPAKHYSGRKVIDSYQTLWASFVLKNEFYQIYESGDSGYENHFKEIWEKYGDFDLVMMDSGQYDVKWNKIHMNPKESVQASIDMHAKVAMPIHWGAYKLANHPWDETVTSFTKYALENELDYITPKIGETVKYQEYQNYQEEWWKNIR